MKKQYLISLVISAFVSHAAAQSALNVLQNGKVASAEEVNQNFALLENLMLDNKEMIAALESKEDQLVEVNCDANGGAALQTAISENQNPARLLRINAQGTCDPIEISQGVVRINGVGGSPLKIVKSASSSATDSAVSVTSTTDIATLVNVQVDAVGLPRGIAVRGSSLFAASIGVSGASSENVSVTEHGLIAFTSINSIGGDTEQALGLFVTQGTVTVLDGRPFGIPLTPSGKLTVKSAGTVARTLNAYLAFNQDDTLVEFSGTEFELEGSSHLRMKNGNINVSDGFYIREASSMNVFPPTDSLVSINGYFQVNGASSVDLDLDESPGGRITHTGDLSLQLNSQITVNGDPNDPTAVQIGLPFEGQAEPSTIEVLFGGALGIVNGRTPANIEMVMGQVLVDSEAVLTNGTSSLLPGYDSTVLFLEASPNTQVTCTTGSRAWVFGSNTSLCSP